MSEHLACPVCGKIAFEVSRLILPDGKANKIFSKLRCGHTLVTKQLEAPVYDEDDILDTPTYIAKNGNKLFPFQENSLEFLYSSGGRCLIAHEMGLGKTVIALAALAQQPSMLEGGALVVCKSNLTFQWMKQSYNWLPGEVFTQIIERSKDFILPNMHLYVISYDLLRRMPAAFFERKFKTVILDEVQHIKSTASKRTSCVRDVCRQAEHIIALSGSPIKNHAGEYFTILNILKPERFPGKEYYYANYVDTYWNGRSWSYGGLLDSDRFREQTEDFILRYEQADVLPDLPPLSRHFDYFDIDSDLRGAYNAVVEELADFIFKEGDGAYSFANYQHVLAYLNKMRQITALAKVDACMDRICDMMLQTEQKVVVFLHHHIARDVLLKKLSKWCADNNIAAPLAITENQSQSAKEATKQKFREDPLSRILVLGMLSSGEGLDGLQDVCRKIIILERQWNPTNEEQPEKRLHRIGQKFPVDVEYLLAIGTCDELFTEKVERKRQICKETYGDSEQVVWNETDVIKDLVDAIVQKRGGRKWAMV